MAQNIRKLWPKQPTNPKFSLSLRPIYINVLRYNHITNKFKDIRYGI